MASSLALMLVAEPTLFDASLAGFSTLSCAIHFARLLIYYCCFRYSMPLIEIEDYGIVHG
jgi:hypothetical protein